MRDEALHFVEALEGGDLDRLRLVPKADLHNHFYLGGHRDHVRARLAVSIPPLTQPLESMGEMHRWVAEHVGPIFEGRRGRMLAFEACLAQASRDGVCVLETGEDVWANQALHGGALDELVEDFVGLQRRVAPHLDFRFQIELSRHCNVQDLERWAAPFFERDGFASLDLSGDESAQPIGAFRRLYRQARSRGLRLKAHVGEWGSPESVQEAVETLELDEVQHGISAARSPAVMRWLADHRIQLNVCPTSNVMLGRVPRLEEHPIRVLFDHGVRVTVNTDDVLVFGNGLSEEFLALHRARLFTARELNDIRESALASRGVGGASQR